MTTNLGRALLAYRQKNDLSQEQLAFEAGVSRSLVAKLETQNKKPEADALLKIMAWFIKEFK